jgi:hypothetical protein
MQYVTARLSHLLHIWNCQIELPIILSTSLNFQCTVLHFMFFFFFFFFNLKNLGDRGQKKAQTLKESYIFLYQCFESSKVTS